MKYLTTFSFWRIEFEKRVKGKIEKTIWDCPEEIYCPWLISLSIIP
jgi:hypothetical protein